jgi:hypothetical protein
METRNYGPKRIVARLRISAIDGAFLVLQFDYIDCGGIFVNNNNAAIVGSLTSQCRVAERRDQRDLAQELVRQWVTAGLAEEKIASRPRFAVRVASPQLLRYLGDAFPTKCAGKPLPPPVCLTSDFG